MPIFLNHTIVPAHDHEASARFFAKIFGLAYDGPAGHFAPVVINDTLTLDFDNREGFESHHYAFLVSEEEFDGIFGRVNEEGMAIIMIEHIMRAVMQFSQRVICLDAGEVIAEGTPEEIVKDEGVERAYLGV